MGPAQDQFQQNWDQMKATESTATGAKQRLLSTERAPGAIQTLNMELDDALAELHMAIESLRDRLSPVISPAPATDSVGLKEPSGPEAYSNVGSRLVDNYYSIKRATRYLNELKNELEL